MKSVNIVAAVGVALALLIPVEAVAAAMWCWGGTCRTFPDASCNEADRTLTKVAGAICFTLGPEMFRPGTDYVVLAENGRAWLVQGTKRTPFASDRMSTSLKQMYARYPEERSDDPGVKAEIEAAWASLFGQRDSGIVSADVLSRFTREMGLSLRRGDVERVDLSGASRASADAARFLGQPKLAEALTNLSADPRAAETASRDPRAYLRSLGIEVPRNVEIQIKPAAGGGAASKPVVDVSIRSGPSEIIVILIVIAM